MLKKAYILFRCLVGNVWMRGSVNTATEPKKILIVQRAQLGDMVCATPLYRAIKIKYPNSKVFVAGKESNRVLLANNNDIDGYITVEKDNFDMAVKKIKQEGFDYGCTIIPDFLGLAALCLGHVKTIACPKISEFSPSNTLSYRILSSFYLKIPLFSGKYFPRQYLNFLKPIGINSEDTRKHLDFTKEAAVTINNFFELNSIGADDFVVGISPAAGNKIKEWPPKNFAQLADYVYNNYKARIIVIGYGKDDVEVNQMLNMLDNETKVINTLNLFNLDELKALMSKMNLFISVDTGPIYIAEAFKVPTIDIIGPIDEREQPPINEFHRVVKSPDRGAPQLSVLNAKTYDFREARRQTESISSEMVIGEFNDLVKILPKLKLIHS